MEFKLTFEDGSNGYLAHHGVKGMHWGVWNAETQAKYGKDSPIPAGGGKPTEEEEERAEEYGKKHGVSKEEALRKLFGTRVSASDKGKTAAKAVLRAIAAPKSDKALASRSKSDRVSDAEERIRESSGLSDSARQVKRTVSIEKQSKKRK